MKMTEKTKRNLAIGGGAVICIALIAAIGLQFGKAPAGEDVLPVDTPPASEIVVDPGEAATGKTEEKSWSSKRAARKRSRKPAAPSRWIPARHRPTRVNRASSRRSPSLPSRRKQ